MTRPWEKAAPRHWETAGIAIYDRTIEIKRPQGPTGVGKLPYQGVSEASENDVADGLPASVQIQSGSSRGVGTLPGDPPGPLQWVIYLPASVVATLPVIMEGDVIYDDLGRRFQVGGYDPSAIGAKIDVVRTLT